MGPQLLNIVSMGIVFVLRIYECMFAYLFVCLMVLNATLNNISVNSWQSVLLLEETGGPGENLTCRKSLTNLIT